VGWRNSGSDLRLRKERRKTERKQRKARQILPPPQKRLNLRHKRHTNPGSNHEETAALESSRVLAEDARLKLKSILKVTTKPQESLETVDDLKVSFHPLEGVSRGLAARLAEDDAEITALEKKLGINGKKGISQAFIDDGLNELLEGLGDIRDHKIFGNENKQSEGESWLARKRNKSKILRQAEKQGVEDAPVPSTSLFEDKDFSEDNNFNENSPVMENATLDSEDVFEGLSSDSDSTPSSSPSKPRRENPYRAPVSHMESAPQKYIPPSLREPLSSEDVRLRRQIQGLVNRLTDTNLLSIVGNIEKLYRENTRQHVTSTLLEVLLAPVCESTSLPDTLIILTAGFITALYKVIGTDFGAQATEHIVGLLDQHHSRATKAQDKTCSGADFDTRKETSNLITLLAELYNFQVVGSKLVFDYIRCFLHQLSELNTKLLLRIIQISGPQLRQDDPSSLKDIVAMLRSALTALGEQNIPVRMKFMIENINDLKNNRMKTGVAASSLTSEHTIRMKKTLGMLNARSIRAVEPLRVGLKDIQESEKKGRWWLVGARWSGDDIDSRKQLNSGVDVMHHAIVQPTTEKGNGGSDLFQLAREQRMNTDIRRAIFITIMSASDCQEAYLRLMKLKLKKVQELEIPKVLIHCLSAEDRYNPYYTLIARKLCGDRKLRMAFQFWLWDVLKRMSEDIDDAVVEESGKEEILSTRQLVHVAKMFGTLIAEGSLSLSVLRNLNLSYLQQKAHMFVEVLLITTFLEAQRRSEHRRDEQAIVKIVSQVKDTPQMISGLRYFLKKFVAKTDIAGGKVETSTVKWACTIATDVLESIYAVAA
jgi:nucleolar MIF4G domain-containing protein 1